MAWYQSRHPFLLSFHHTPIRLLFLLLLLLMMSVAISRAEPVRLALSTTEDSEGRIVVSKRGSGHGQQAISSQTFPIWADGIGSLNRFYLYTKNDGSIRAIPREEMVDVLNGFVGKKREEMTSKELMEDEQQKKMAEEMTELGKKTAARESSSSRKHYRRTRLWGRFPADADELGIGILSNEMMKMAHGSTNAIEMEAGKNKGIHPKVNATDESSITTAEGEKGRKRKKEFCYQNQAGKPDFTKAIANCFERITSFPENDGEAFIKLKYETICICNSELRVRHQAISLFKPELPFIKFQPQFVKVFVIKAKLLENEQLTTAERVQARNSNFAVSDFERPHFFYAWENKIWRLPEHKLGNLALPEAVACAEEIQMDEVDGLKVHDDEAPPPLPSSSRR